MSVVISLSCFVTDVGNTIYNADIKQCALVGALMGDGIATPLETINATTADTDLEWT